MWFLNTSWRLPCQVQSGWGQHIKSGKWTFKMCRFESWPRFGSFVLIPHTGQSYWWHHNCLWGSSNTSSPCMLSPSLRFRGLGRWEYSWWRSCPGKDILYTSFLVAYWRSWRCLGNRWWRQQRLWRTCPFTIHQPPIILSWTWSTRAENLQGRGMWGTVEGRKRCVVPTQGYVTYHLQAVVRDPVVCDVPVVVEYTWNWMHTWCSAGLCLGPRGTTYAFHTMETLSFILIPVSRSVLTTCSTVSYTTIGLPYYTKYYACNMNYISLLSATLLQVYNCLLYNVKCYACSIYYIALS